MSRRNRRAGVIPADHPEWAQHLAGVSANFDGDCGRCPNPIIVGQRVVRHGETWIHIGCASGADDE